MSPINLKDISLCALDSAYLPLTARAMEISMKGCAFGDAALISDTPVAGSFRHIDDGGLGKKSAWEYNQYLIKELGDCFDTPFILIIQWDGYVTDPRRWDPMFLQYDYIGPKWPWHKDGKSIGSGGFTLRSKKLCEALKDPQFQIPKEYVNEDDYIGRAARPALEAQFGIKFPPESVADRFAYERSVPAFSTFGFHGVFNLWRHIDDSEMINLIPLMPQSLLRKIEYLELMVSYFVQRRFPPLDVMYARLRATETPAAIKQRIATLTKNPQLAQEMFQACESGYALTAAPVQARTGTAG